MPALATPVQWHSPSAAYAALKPLLDASGRIDNVIVRLAPNHYPPQRTRYLLARYAVVGATGCWLDAASARLLGGHVTGWRLP